VAQGQTHGSVPQGGTGPHGEARGAGPTQEGTTGTGLDGIVAGAAIVLSLFGLVAILADIVTGESIVPDNGLVVAGIMVGCLVLGAVLGALASARSAR